MKKIAIIILFISAATAVRAVEPGPVFFLDPEIQALQEETPFPEKKPVFVPAKPNLVAPAKPAPDFAAGNWQPARTVAKPTTVKPFRPATQASRRETTPMIIPREPKKPIQQPPAPKRGWGWFR